MFNLSGGRITQIGILSNAILSLSIICNMSSLAGHDQATLYFLGTTFAIIGSLLIMVAFLEMASKKRDKSASVSKYILAAVPLNLTAFAVAIVFKTILSKSSVYAILLLLLYFLSFILYLFYFFGTGLNTKTLREKILTNTPVAFFLSALIMFAYVIFAIASITYFTSVFLVFIGALFLCTGTILQTLTSIKPRHYSRNLPHAFT